MPFNFWSGEVKTLNVEITEAHIEVIVHYRVDVDSIVLERVYLALSDSWENILPIIERAPVLMMGILHKIAAHIQKETEHEAADLGVRYTPEPEHEVAFR